MKQEIEESINELEQTLEQERYKLTRMQEQLEKQQRLVYTLEGRLLQSRDIQSYLEEEEDE